MPESSAATTSGNGRHTPRGTVVPKPQEEEGLIPALGIHVFGYDIKGTANQMRTTWEKIINYVSSAYSNDISTELRTRKTLVFDPPQHSQAVFDEHIELEKLRKIQIGRIITGVRTDLKALKKTLGHSTRVAWRRRNQSPSKATTKPLGRTSSKTTKNATRTSSNIVDKFLVEHDPTWWSTTIESGDPLLMYSLIKCTILAQTEDTYPLAIIWEQARTHPVPLRTGTTHQRTVVRAVYHTGERS
jgi:hypothetical protein